MGHWAFGPGVHVVGAEQVDGGWLVSEIGGGNQWCPDCDERSKSRHSWHNRCLQDLPFKARGWH
jgi:transposase